MSEVIIGLVSIIPLYLILPLLKQFGFPGQSQQLAGQLDVPLSTRASELTLGFVKDQLELINKKLDTNLASRASEDTLAALNSYLVYRLDDNLSTRASESTLLKFRPIFKNGVFNQSYTAGQNIFASDLVPSSPPCLFKIYFVAADSAQLRVARTKAGVTVIEFLNQGSALAADAAYIFEIMVDENESINLRYGIDTTIYKCSVWEIDMVTA